MATLTDGMVHTPEVLGGCLVDINNAAMPVSIVHFADRGAGHSLDKQGRFLLLFPFAQLRNWSA